MVGHSLGPAFAHRYAVIGWHAELEPPMPSTLPDLHADMLERIIAVVREDTRFEAILAGGSLVHGGFDQHSDLDLVLVVTSDSYAEVMESRPAIADGMGELLAAFTGEHVGEPRLLICLYGPP